LWYRFSSTLALSEQGARVTGIDIEEDSLAIAQKRLSAYALQAEFKRINANEIINHFSVGSFDTIIFYAVLEHMTIDERLSSLSSAYSILNKGGFMVIIETPNRLWYFDGHTSLLPFFHWLPDELAFKYTKFSKREKFHEIYSNLNKQRMAFLRRGRGMSFHEFDISIAEAKRLNVVSSLSRYFGLRYSLRLKTLDRRYKRILKKIYPGLHDGFYDQNLNLIIEKC